MRKELSGWSVSHHKTNETWFVKLTQIFIFITIRYSFQIVIWVSSFMNSIFQLKETVFWKVFVTFFQNSDSVCLRRDTLLVSCNTVKGEHLKRACFVLILLCSKPNISASNWPNFKIKDSFEIYMTSAIQNCPYFSILAN